MAGTKIFKVDGTLIAAAPTIITHGLGVDPANGRGTIIINQTGVPVAGTVVAVIGTSSSTITLQASVPVLCDVTIWIFHPIID